MPDNPILAWTAFVMGSSLVLLAFLVVSGRHGRLDSRLQELGGKGAAPGPDNLSDFARAALPRVGSVLMPRSEEERTKLQARLAGAGFYSRPAPAVFLGVKVCLMVGPPLAAVLLGLAGVFPMQKVVVFGCLAGGVGMIAPAFYLDKVRAGRQVQFRRALPDALDVLVICLEGGSSLASALRRVTEEMRTVHPALAFELGIVHRETQMGRTAGEALRQFGERADLEEIRSLASVVQQSEKYGASLVKALRVHAEGLRVRRIQTAEEMAQKAVVKLLIPTALFIMPAIFLVILGPTSVQFMKIMREVMR